MTKTKSKTSSKNLTRNVGLEHNAVKLWVLRLLVELDGNVKFLDKTGFSSSDVANFLGLEAFIQGEYDPIKAKAEIVKNYKLVSETGTGLPTKTTLAKNITKLAKCLSLTSVEKSILHLIILIKSNHILSESFELHGQISTNKMIKLLAGCLNLEHGLLTHALRTDAVLISSGLIQLDTCSYYSFESKVTLLDGLIEIADSPDLNPIDMFKNCFSLASTAKLKKSDYPHCNDDIELLHQYINFVHKTNKIGANVLIYGPPGTGKTEFSKMIAKLTKSVLYEVGFEGESMRSLKGFERFRAYRVAQILFCKSKNHMMLFDEVEDVFTQPLICLEKNGNKAWINKVLEENPVPTFWLTNSINSIDHAFIRRFDFIIEMKTPPKNVREKLLNHYLADLPVSEHWKKQMSKHEELPPATIERAANILKSISLMNPNVDVDKSIHRLIGNSLEAMDMARPIIKAEKIELDYKLEMLNADCDIQAISNGLIDKGQARVCLYGPPGTGKTAFGRYIADISGKQLMVKKASDIISPYLGVSERNMARMFYEALEQDAVLLLDEADSYLQNRKFLQRSWEVSGVNEMLTQIESFDGVFICSTNLMDSFDAAALRRFDLKIKFSHLNEVQAWGLFVDATKRLEIKLDNNISTKVSALKTLTPGDFATVLRQSRFSAIKDSWDLLHRLKSECDMKPEGSKHSIGFH